MGKLTDLLEKHGESNLDVDQLEQGAREHMFGTENPGTCVACGEQQDGCEPDAEGYICEACGEPAVCGDESLWMTIV